MTISKMWVSFKIHHSIHVCTLMEKHIIFQVFNVLISGEFFVFHGFLLI